MGKFVVREGNADQIAAPAAVSAGDVFEGAGGIGVYAHDAASGQEVTVVTQGVVELPKETGVAFTFLDQLYYDAVNNRLDKTNSNIPCGLAAKDAASGDTTAWVRLNVGAGDS